MPSPRVPFVSNKKRMTVGSWQFTYLLPLATATSTATGDWPSAAALRLLINSRFGRQTQTAYMQINSEAN